VSGAQDLRGRPVIVTSASSGIGAATARALHAADAHPVLAARRAQRLEALRAELGGALSVQADITDTDQITRLTAAVLGRHGRIDRLVNNAGVSPITPQILTDRLVSLADPRSDFGAENMVPLVYKPAMTATIIATLNAISAKLTMAILLQIDNAIITQHAGYATVTAGFLKAEGLTLLSN
jgi:NAD(P)-dependent dehydrogenase (short-subunit alcohol dehydrogenase family)